MTLKYGYVKGVQRYKCDACGRQFIGGVRSSDLEIWTQYSSGKQTYSQLSKTDKCLVKTIQRIIDSFKVKMPVKTPCKVVVLMDTTYFGRGFGVMLFKDSITKENLLKFYVKTETNSKYMHGIDLLISKGFIIQAIVCDGRKGLINSFEDIPVQLCQFHQVAFIRSCLTKKPKLQAGKELAWIVSLMKDTDKESFVGALEQGYLKWHEFLNQRTMNPITNKSFYTHKRLRSTYRSLINNQNWLFTWYDKIELKIPNTTNAMDGHFADLINKLRNHNGLSIKRKIKFIDGFFKG